MDNNLVQAINTLSEKFGIAIDWSSKNVIPYLQQLFSQYIHYEITRTIIEMIILLIFIFLSFMYFKWIYKKHKDFKADIYVDYFDEHPIALLLSGVIGVVSACILFGFVSDLFYLIKCFTIPDVVIFEYITNLIS
jgi:hypothetical protein